MKEVPHFDERFDGKQVTFHADGKSKITETSQDGRGEVLFVSKNSIVSFNGTTQPPLKWAKCLKCADGAVIVIRDSGVDLFVVELKTTLSPKEMTKACDQFLGGYINALAICGVLGFQEVNQAICVVSYESEKISEFISANPNVIKMPALQTKKGIREWHNGRVSIPSLGSCQLLKNQRKNGQGVVDLG